MVVICVLSRPEPFLALRGAGCGCWGCRRCLYQQWPSQDAHPVPSVFAGTLRPQSRGAAPSPAEIREPSSPRAPEGSGKLRVLQQHPALRRCGPTPLHLQQSLLLSPIICLFTAPSLRSCRENEERMFYSTSSWLQQLIIYIK